MDQSFFAHDDDSGEFDDDGANSGVNDSADGDSESDGGNDVGNESGILNGEESGDGFSRREQPTVKAERVEFLWGTILASVGNASADVTLKADASGGSWFDNLDSASPVPTDGESFYAAPFPKAPSDFLASVTIRTSRLSHEPPGRTGRVAATDGNDFVVTGSLGRGGMGVVYSARQSSLNREVAVKMISPETANREGPRRKMVAEALVTGDLDHPNIIPIYDLGRTESGELFYAMKIVRGEPWSQSLATKSERENLDILLRICDAVAFAHDKGIIHRDLKPANVMIGNYGEVLLMDWGLAVSLYQSDKAEELSYANAVAGTPAYMAPEMALGEVDRIGTASDIYLLGAILYEVLTGLRPHRGANASECLLAAAENRIEPAFHMDDLVRVALRAMATNPYDRYETVKEFQHAVVTVQTHRESLVLAANAAESLRAAVAGRDYNLYAQAIFAYDEAVKLWDGNADAAAGRLRARVEYARCAYQKGDYDLALTTIADVEADDVRDLREAIQAAREDLAARKRRIRILTRTAIALTVAVVVILGAATLIISDRMAKEREARELASQALEETVAARRSESIAAAQREAALLQQREAQEAALVAATEREAALRREVAALALAEEERRRKEEAEQARLEIERELSRRGHLEDDSWWGFDAAEAARKQAAAAASWNVPVRLRPILTTGTETAMALIPPGVFVMGSSPTDRFHAPDEFLHRVVLEQPYYMGEAEVTRAEWRAVVGIEDRADLMAPYHPELADETEEAFRDREFTVWGWRTLPLSPEDENLPATGISPDEIDRLFLPRLAGPGLDGWTFDVPTEAEWEYACRAGTASDFFSGEIRPGTELPGWMRVNSGVRLHPVRELLANPFSLYDTHGNAGEIVRDYYAFDFYRASPEIEPLNITPTGFRVFRGGTFIHDESKCRSASRFTIHRENRYQQVGFRLVVRKER
ncbi:MAG: SUMF1/EgtB/PvdO family nonheme iron enzyme [Planctomycetaceae bacterium]|nr:SUMF1/EgtB/PvdO family nonheme iron enzyme [Planctomycetaceae bacterium]